MKKLKYLIMAMAVVLAGCDAWDDVKKTDGSSRSKNLYELLAENSDLSDFAEALRVSGYAEKLGADMNYTVFAPKNSAITGLDMTDTEHLAAFVQNYISEQIAYTGNAGTFDISRIRMLNGKTMAVAGNLVSGSAVSTPNMSAKNGVLHIIDSAIEERMSIWEYLQSLENEPVVKFITSFSEQVMDMERSVRTGVNSEGKPVYDTVWDYRNTLLDNSPLANESATSTFLLLDQSGMNALKTKYAKYFAQKTPEKLDSAVTREIVSDMMLRYRKIETDGRYANTQSVLVDVNTGDITDSYTASNGIVYRVKAAGVKMYRNKIQPLFIEAEDYIMRAPDAWQTRPRTWASGGKDVALKAITRHAYDREIHTVYASDTLTDIIGADSIVYRDTVIISKQNNRYDMTYRSNEWPGGAVYDFNAAISYKPHMYSVPYKIFWKAYDDNSQKVHIDSLGVPMLFHQKMYISFPGEPELIRTTAGVPAGTEDIIQIKNNFSPFTVMGAEMRAGENVETQLVRYQAQNNHLDFGNSYLLQRFQDEPDAFGYGDVLICPYAGKATLFVSNTSMLGSVHSDNVLTLYLNKNRSANCPGMIFLDYIRLEPQVDPNE